MVVFYLGNPHFAALTDVLLKRSFYRPRMVSENNDKVT